MLCQICHVERAQCVSNLPDKENSVSASNLPAEENSVCMSHPSHQENSVSASNLSRRENSVPTFKRPVTSDHSYATGSSPRYLHAADNSVLHQLQIRISQLRNARRRENRLRGKLTSWNVCTDYNLVLNYNFLSSQSTDFGKDTICCSIVDRRTA